MAALRMKEKKAKNVTLKKKLSVNTYDLLCLTSSALTPFARWSTPFEAACRNRKVPIIILS